MDLLFSKYASPFLLLDSFISAGRFCDFILKFIDLENEKTMWEFYLHKVYDMSYDDFRTSCSREIKPETTEEEVEGTILESQSILNEFNPQR